MSGGWRVKPGGARVLAFTIIGGAIVAIWAALGEANRYPRTDAAEIDAPTVAISSTVPGRIIEISVANNATVGKGDVLLQIDPEPYRLRLVQAEAELRAAEAEVAQGTRNIATEQATAGVADKQIACARANAQMAEETLKRLEPLLPKRFVTAQQVDEARTLARDAQVGLQQALQQAQGANSLVSTLDTRQALADVSRAAVDIARRDLENTTVRAPIGGKVVGLKMAAGKMVLPAETLFTLIDTAEWEAVAFFRETDLASIRIGGRADIFVMTDPSKRLTGTVSGIGWGIRSDESATVLGIPIVSNSLNWVRVAKRFPVHIRLESPPEDLMRLGASAVVAVGPPSGKTNAVSDIQ